MVFTTVLLFLVYSKIDFLGLLDRFSLVSPFKFFVCCLLYLVGQFLSAYKWGVLLKDAGLFSNIKEVLRAYFLGMFINSFGLGTVGGDVARGFSLSCPEGRRSSVLASVVADRIHGLTVLLSIGLIALLIVDPPFLPDVAFNLAAVTALVFVICWFLGPFVLIKFLPSWFPKRDKFVMALEGFPRQGSLLFHISLVSATFHCVQIYMAYMIFQALSDKMSLSIVFTTIPFVNVASALPISINGLGVREVVSVYMMTPSGIDKEIAVAFSAIWVFVVTLISGIGGLFVIPKLGEGVGSFLNRIKDKEK